MVCNLQEKNLKKSDRLTKAIASLFCGLTSALSLRPDQITAIPV